MVLQHGNRDCFPVVAHLDRVTFAREGREVERSDGQGYWDQLLSVEDDLSLL